MTHTTARLALITCLAVLAPTLAVAQEPQLPPASAEHKLLQKDSGTWDATVKVWPVPNAPQPLESKAVEKNELLPGGMWIVSRFDGDFGGMNGSTLTAALSDRLWP